MRIENSRYTERFGSVMIHDVQKVLELDSGRASERPLHQSLAVRKIDEDVIKDLEERMAIVIPTKDEKLKLFEGVISGIPHECLKIVVSNSERERFDRFRTERDTLEQYCRFTRSQALIVHQKDPLIAEALRAAGYPHILGDDGLVSGGKAEGMIIGTLLAKMAGKAYVGFIDADNYFPGSVWEYVRCYAAGLSMSSSPYAMVRVLWRYKPKMSAHGMYFKKWGRVSQTTNRVINSLISINTGFETDIIKTGNAGEHAMSLKLAEILPFASGYAVEPQELLSIFEEFGGVYRASYPEALQYGIEILQIESRNPHLHEEKGATHLQNMLLSALSSIYHSPLCPEETQELAMEELCRQEILCPGEAPPQPRLIPPLAGVGGQQFQETLEKERDLYVAPQGK